MSILITDEEFDMGISMCHDRIIEAVKSYEDFLTTFGTVPNMELANQLKKLTNQILTHDRNNEIIPFRHGIKVEEAE